MFEKVCKEYNVEKTIKCARTEKYGTCFQNSEATCLKQYKDEITYKCPYYDGKYAPLTETKQLSIIKYIGQKYLIDYKQNLNPCHKIYTYGFGIPDLHLQCFGETFEDALCNLLLEIKQALDVESINCIKQILQEGEI